MKLGKADKSHTTKIYGINQEILIKICSKFDIEDIIEVAD